MEPLKRPYIYIDDSGDTGFKTDQGSSTHFVLAACVFSETEEIEKLSSVMNQCVIDHKARFKEYKYAKLKNRRIADALFAAIQDIDFSIRILLVDKSQIRSPRLRNNSAEFRTEMHKQFLTHFHGTILSSKVFIDGRDGIAAGMKESRFYKQCADSVALGSVSEVRFVDSEKSRPIQLADMIAGSTRRMIENSG